MAAPSSYGNTIAHVLAQLEAHVYTETSDSLCEQPDTCHRITNRIRLATQPGGYRILVAECLGPHVDLGQGLPSSSPSSLPS